MAIETKPFDVAEILNSEERISAYLEEAFVSGDPRIIASAIGDVARSRNPSTIARLACREKRSTRRFRRKATRRFPP
jgi:probable addiction module antidote protein